MTSKRFKTRPLSTRLETRAKELIVTEREWFERKPEPEMKVNDGAKDWSCFPAAPLVVEIKNIIDNQTRKMVNFC